MVIRSRSFSRTPSLNILTPEVLLILHRLQVVIQRGETSQYCEHSTYMTGDTGGVRLRNIHRLYETGNACRIGSVLNWYPKVGYLSNVIGHDVDETLALIRVACYTHIYMLVVR